MYNPFVVDEDIVTFLKRFCDVLHSGTKIKDSLGFWNGKRMYKVRLRPREGAHGGVIHPPGSFSIGSNRGYLYYPGQPIRCRRCGEEGHNAEGCKKDFCRKCQKGGHTTATCVAQAECNLCGDSDHIFRNCPERAGSYAGATMSKKVVSQDTPDIESSQQGLRSKEARVLTAGKVLESESLGTKNPKETTVEKIMTTSDPSQRASTSSMKEPTSRRVKRRAETELETIEEEERKKTEQDPEVLMELNQPATESESLPVLPAGTKWGDIVEEQQWIIKKGKAKESDLKLFQVEISNQFDILGAISSSEESNADRLESAELIVSDSPGMTGIQESIEETSLTDFVEDTIDCAGQRTPAPSTVEFETQAAVEEFIEKMIGKGDGT